MPCFYKMTHSGLKKTTKQEFLQFQDMIAVVTCVRSSVYKRHCGERSSARVQNGAGYRRVCIGVSDSVQGKGEKHTAFQGVYVRRENHLHTVYK